MLSRRPSQSSVRTDSSVRGRRLMPGHESEGVHMAWQPGVLQMRLATFLAQHEERLIALRRDLHMHPELGFAEYRTTRVISEQLRAAGLRPVTLPKGTGLICDIGPPEGSRTSTGSSRCIATRASRSASSGCEQGRSPPHATRST